MSVKGWLGGNGAVTQANLIAATQVMNADGKVLRDNGFKNYVRAPFDTLTNPGLWVASAGTITIGTTTTAANLPSGSFGSALVFTRASGSAYVYTRFTLDTVDCAKKLQLLWDQIYAGTAGDYTVTVYSNTLANYSGTSTLITPVVSSIPAGSITFNTTFDTPSSAAPYMEIRINGIAGTTPLYLNNVTVTPGQVVQGAAVGNTTAYTPTFVGFGTISATAFEYVRVGDRMRVNGRVTIGAPTAVTASITLPTGATLATTNAQNPVTIVGQWWRAVTGASSLKQGSIICDATGSALVLYFGYQTYSTADSPFTKQTGSNVISTGEILEIAFDVAVAEWAGNGTVNLGPGAQIEYAWNSDLTNSTVTTGFAYGPGGARFGSYSGGDIKKRVRFQYPIQATDMLVLQFSADSGVTWADFGAGYIESYYSQSSTNYGWRFDPVNSTDVDVVFGPYRAATGATFASAGAAWSTIASNAALFWRVMKAKPSAPVGFGLATNTVTGLTVAPKQYVVGTAYTNGTPTFAAVSNAPVLVRSVLVPYQTYDGAWRMRFNVVYTSGLATSNSFTISGMTSKNVASYTQCFGGSAPSGPTPTSLQLPANGNTFTGVAGSSQNIWSFSGDFELDSKPTWAD